jgi:hypothetical protein
LRRRSAWSNNERPNDFSFRADEFDHEFLRRVRRLHASFESFEPLNEIRPHFDCVPEATSLRLYPMRKIFDD